MEDRSNRSELSPEETELVALIATLRMEPTPEADFEQRFLYDLHERIVRDSVCCPARQRFWEHLWQFVSFSRMKLAFGASTLGLGAVALGLFSFSTDEEAVLAAEVSPVRRVTTPYEESLASLSPSIDTDAERCTTIRIGKQADAVYDTNAVALRTPYFPSHNAGNVMRVSALPQSAYERPYSVPSFTGARRTGGL